MQAADYASTRLQGRSPDQKDPESAPLAINEHSDVRRMLLASKSYVEGGLALSLYAAKCLDEKLISTDAQKSDRLGLLLDILTPILKGWTSKWSLVANDFAIQVHGGYGYTRDYQVEQLWRDNRLNPIHEGTDGIQAIDLLGRKVRMQDGAAFNELTDQISKTISRAVNRSVGARHLADDLAKVLEQLIDVSVLIDSQELLSERIADAWLYADAIGHVVIAWIWLEQFLASEDMVDVFGESKRATAQYFYTYELPNVTTWLNILNARHDLLLKVDSKIFLP